MSFRFNRSERARKSRRPVMVLVAALAALGPALAIIGLAAGPASAAPLADAPPITIHLTNASSYCVDVKNDNNSANNPVYLYKCSQAKSYKWDELEGVTCPGDPGPQDCLVFVDAQNTSVCFGLNDNRDAVLLGCGQGGALAPYRAVWVPSGTNGLVNTAFGTPEGSLWTPKDSNTSPLSGQDRQAGGPGWWQWSGF